MLVSAENLSFQKLSSGHMERLLGKDERVRENHLFARVGLVDVLDQEDALQRGDQYIGDMQA